MGRNEKVYDRPHVPTITTAAAAMSLSAACTSVGVSFPLAPAVMMIIFSPRPLTSICAVPVLVPSVASLRGLISQISI
jgi:hypothetical protein